MKSYMLFYCGLVTFVVSNQNFHGNNENYCTSVWLCLCLPYTLQDYVVPCDLFYTLEILLSSSLLCNLVILENFMNILSLAPLYDSRNHLGY